jgi:cobalt-zinc-cadmium efflux system membrane fusion protein
MTTRRKLIVAFATLALVGVVALFLLRGWHLGSQADAAAPVRDVPHLDGKWIRYTPSFAQRSKIEFATVETAGLSPVVSVTGTVTFDPQKVAAVGARIPGRVRKVFKFEGDHVDEGTVLAELESAELGQAQAKVLEARAHFEAAEANEKREHQLAEARVSSQRDYEVARAAAAAAKSDLYAAEQRVRAFGATGGAEIGILQLTSPISGKVVEAKVARGQTVEPSFTAFRVADLKRVWIELAVFERELGHVHKDDPVEISPQTNTAVVLKGTVAHVGDVIDLETRSAPVRVVVDNPDEALRPGQSVLARIRTKTSVAAAIAVPRDAVTTVDGKPTVFVAHDDTSVEPRAITIGGRDANRVEVLSGLQPGERIAVSGVFALKSEVFR